MLLASHCRARDTRRARENADVANDVVRSSDARGRGSTLAIYTEREARRSDRRRPLRARVIDARAEDGEAGLVLRPFVLTVGGGLQYVKHTPDVDLNRCNNTGRSPFSCIADQLVFNGSGFRPRLLLTIGFGA